MINAVYFFDTYAIIEILKGNENYEKYMESIVITTKLNLFELYYSILRSVGKKEADYLMGKYSEFTVDFNTKIIKKAAELKLKYKKRKLSMADCIGYFLADDLQVKFLTGDKEFEDMKNVEYVK